jgi:hypothetical protein
MLPGMLRHGLIPSHEIDMTATDLVFQPHRLSLPLSIRVCEWCQWTQEYDYVHPSLSLVREYQALLKGDYLAA